MSIVELDPASRFPSYPEVIDDGPQIEDLIDIFRRNPQTSVTIMLAYGTTRDPIEGTPEGQRLRSIKEDWIKSPIKARHTLTLLLAIRGNLSEQILEEIDRFGLDQEQQAKNVPGSVSVASPADRLA